VEALVGELRAAGGTADGLVADLASLAEVAELARRISLPLDLLINNAGVGFGANRRVRETSHDGFELRFAVNYLAPFVLTRALLARGLPTRAVVNVASAGQQSLDLDDLQGTHDYDGVRAYCRSKLALIMFTLDILHVLDAALNQHTTGAYFDQQRVARADAQAYDVTVRRSLRAQTTALVRRFL
jgi:NAD(P)-dependent dehydrogenase (short-subunit alcohol dehydrogenase family)